MKKLAFTAHCHQDHNNQDQSPVTQQYVAELLRKNLTQYGFDTHAHEQPSELSVTVEDHPVAIGVNCKEQDEQGMLSCEINVKADQEQDWFTKIETQSIVKQLAHAVENSLKSDPSLGVFQWRD